MFLRFTQMFAAGLSSMFEMMDINEDCYGLGYISKLVASELANMPSARGRRKVKSWILIALHYLYSQDNNKICLKLCNLVLNCSNLRLYGGGICCSSQDGYGMV